MKTIELFTVPDAPECSVVLPQGLTLLDAECGFDDEIQVYYIDQNISDDTVTLTWYALGLGMEVADNFPGTYFKQVTMPDGSARFLFFKQDAKKRAPIVARLPGDKDKK